MKRTFKSLAVLALSALAMVSCQKELLGPATQEGKEVAVSLDLTTPLMGTKAYADGTTVDVVHVHVYQHDANGNLTYIAPATQGAAIETPSKDVAMSNGAATYSTRLVTGQKYTFVFWAENSSCGAYAYNSDSKTVTVDYTGAAGNDESRDAFYAVLPDVTITGAYSASVTLNRPFAQINFGASDYEAAKAAGIEVTGAAVKLTGIATSINLLEGTVSGSETVTFAEADLPTDPETLSAAGESYKYVAMDYVLVGKDRKTLSDVTLTIAATGTLSTTPEYTYTNVPLQGNYRTNIVGNLFTSPADITITVDPAWSTPESNYIIVAPGVRQFVDNEYEIYAKEGLDWLAKTVNGRNSLSGKTVKLAADLDMTGIDYVPAGNTIASYPSTAFAGVFDGQGHTISNLSVASHTGQYSAAGLFGAITGTVKNVKLANVNISSDHYAGGVVGYISNNTGASVQNCSVEGGSIKSTAHLKDDGSYDDGDKAGGIVGYITAVDYIDGCSVKNLTITAYRDLGAIVGCAAGSGTVKVTNCTVGDNVLVVVDNSHNYKNYTTNEAHNAGNFVGRKATSVDETGSTGGAQIVFPAENAVATVNGTSYATLAEAVSAVSAAPNGSTLMILEPQNFSSASSSLQFGAGKSVTVMGAGEGSVIDASAKTSSVACTGDITFVNMTFKFNQGSTEHYNIGLFNGGGTHVYENCKFEGQTVAWGNTTYNNCEFTSTVKYAAWVYSGTVVYNNCKFSGVDRAVKVFDEGPALDVTYNNCTFSCQRPNKAAVEVDVTNNTTNLVKVAINNPVLEGTFGNAEHWGTQYFNLEGDAHLVEGVLKGCNGVVTIDGKTYAKVATNNAFDVAVNETAKEIDVRMTGPCGITTSNFYNKLGGPETTVINIDGNDNALTVNSTYRNHITTDNNAKIVLKNVTMDSNYKVEGSTWDDYGLIFDCPTEFTDVTFSRQLVLSKPYKHILNNVTINQTSPTGDMYALWIQAGADVTFNGGTVTSINPNSGSLNRAIKIADEYISEPQLTKLNVSGVTFKSQKKAAVLVTSTAGANIIWGEGNDISQVAADQTNAVWNDANRTAAWDLVAVTGCYKFQEQ